MKNSRFRTILFFYLIFVPCYLISALTLDEVINSLQPIVPNETVQFRWDPLLREGVFNLGDHYGTFSTASRQGMTGYLIFNNQEVFSVPLPYNESGRLVFPDTFASVLRDTFVRLYENDLSRFRIAAIIIDPGHGGRDPGTVGTLTTNGRTTTFYEKDIVLDVALMLKDRLIRTYSDKQIIMTRETDIYISLEQRSDMANAVAVKDNEAVIFISIHANWGANPSARGYEVWHITSSHRRSLLDPAMYDYSPDIMAILNAMLEEEFTTESILLADSILQGFDQVFGNSLPSRGRKANDWFVVRSSRMPAVLVELGFVSNRQDAELMTSEEGLQRFTDSLYNGIVNFIGIFER